MRNHIVALILALQLLFTPLPNSAGTAHAQDVCTIIVDSTFEYWEWCQAIAIEVLDSNNSYLLQSISKMRGP